MQSAYGVDKRDIRHMELAYCLTSNFYRFPPENGAAHPPFAYCQSAHGVTVWKKERTRIAVAETVCGQEVDI